MSHNAPPKFIVDSSFYDILLKRRADHNARLAADGLPPITDDFPFITAEQAQAEANQRAASKSAANLAPPPPTRGPLPRAAKAKITERKASIPGFERHSRKCQLCRSPYVDLIEQSYVQWERVDLICRYFQLADADTVYRHARAAGLDVLRRQNARWVVEQFIEQWRTVKISSATVIRSIRALSCLDENGCWTDLPKTHIVLRGSDASPAAVSAEVEGHVLKPTSTVSDTGLLEPGPTASSAPSFERSEPHENSSADSQSTGGFRRSANLSAARASQPEADLPPSGLAPQASSLELPEPNRVSMGN